MLLNKVSLRNLRHIEMEMSIRESEIRVQELKGVVKSLAVD